MEWFCKPWLFFFFNSSCLTDLVVVFLPDYESGYSSKICTDQRPQQRQTIQYFTDNIHCIFASYYIRPPSLVWGLTVMFTYLNSEWLNYRAYRWSQTTIHSWHTYDVNEDVWMHCNSKCSPEPLPWFNASRRWQNQCWISSEWIATKVADLLSNLVSILFLETMRSWQYNKPWKSGLKCALAGDYFSNLICKDL